MSGYGTATVRALEQKWTLLRKADIGFKYTKAAFLRFTAVTEGSC